MNKVIKVCLVSVALVSVFALCSFTVSAATNYFENMFHLSSVWVFNESGSKVEVPVTTSTPEYVDHAYKVGSQIGIPNITGGILNGFGFSAYADGYIRVQQGYYFAVSITITGVSYDDMLEPVNVFFSASDGNVYHLNTIVNKISIDDFEIIAAGKVGEGQELRLGTLHVNAPSIAMTRPNMGYTFSVNMELNMNPTLAQKQHEELLDTIERVEDNILHGWNSDSHLKEDMDDFKNEYDSAEDGVFGDRSQDDAMGDVDSAFDNGSSVMPDPSGAGSVVVSRFLNQVLDALGTGVLSVIVMSCMIGLALTILGRSF